MTDSEQHSPEVSGEAGSSRIEAERESDQKADTLAIFVIFCMLILGAVHFISGGLV